MRAYIPIWMLAAHWSQGHDISLRSGVQAIPCPADIARSVVDLECLVLIDAGADDLKSRSIVASEVGVRWILGLISEARDKVVFQFGSKILYQSGVRSRNDLKNVGLP